jgi:uncharacterized FlaG/YvyC family protein
MNPVRPLTANGGADPPAIDTSAGDARRAITRDVADGVARLNEIEYAGQGREITFSIDRATRLPVVKMVNTNTNEVVDQWPAQYVLQLAADYAKSTREAR